VVEHGEKARWAFGGGGVNGFPTQDEDIEQSKGDRRRGRKGGRKGGREGGREGLPEPSQVPALFSGRTVALDHGQLGKVCAVLKDGHERVGFLLAFDLWSDEEGRGRDGDVGGRQGKRGGWVWDRVRFHASFDNLLP
jgi:hypothetical protein